jgi:hypothetical protein
MDISPRWGYRHFTTENPLRIPVDPAHLKVPEK